MYVWMCVRVRESVRVYVCRLVRRSNLELGTDLDPLRSPSESKVRGDEIEELHNRLKISIDRRSFKFRHPGEAQSITLMIYDLSWNVHTVPIHPNENSQFHSSLTRVRESSTILYIIYHNIRLGRLNSIHGVLLTKGNSFNRRGRNYFPPQVERVH